MSSEDEDEQFVGDEHGLHGDGEVVADLVGDDMQQDEDESGEDEDGVPENAYPDHDDSIHTFDGHKGTPCVDRLLHTREQRDIAAD